MITEKDFPQNVQEVLQLMRSGPLLGDSTDITEDRISNIRTALEMQQDEDMKMPYRFIIDITEDASGEIETPPFDERKSKLIELFGGINYFDYLVAYFSKHKISTLLDPQEIIDLSESIYEDLMLCAEARLLMQDSHPYFEKMFSVYRRQGYPCAWIGGDDCRNGDFVVYAG